MQQFSWKIEDCNLVDVMYFEDDEEIIEKEQGRSGRGRVSDDSNKLFDRSVSQDSSIVNDHEEALKDKLYTLIKPAAERFCKKFCYDNRGLYKCTLDSAWSRSQSDAVFCEWGNATILWMFEDLYNKNRISKLRGNYDSDTINRYFGKIIYSIAFRERFKNWRFQRRIQIPAYKKAIDPYASKVFWWLCDQDEVANIAQRLLRSEADVVEIANKIKSELIRRKRDHLLKPSLTISLVTVASSEDIYEVDISTEDVSSELARLKSLVLNGFASLDWREQFVLDMMIIEGASANNVLEALLKQNVSIRDDIDVKELTIQHIYYFLRKALVKLKEIVQQESNGSVSADLNHF